MGLNRENREEQLWDLHQTEEQVNPIELTGEIAPNLFGIEPVKAQEMVSGLSVVFAEREVLKNAYIDVIDLSITTENLSVFKELRLKIVKNRTQGFKVWHTKNKAFYLAGGRFVDAIYNKEALENEQMESKLLDAEKYFENMEKARLEDLRVERNTLISLFIDVVPNDLETLEQDVFDSYLDTKKKQYTDKLEADRIEAERIENVRIEREKEIEAQRLENLRLKQEAEAREKQQAKELAIVEAEKKAIAEKAEYERLSEAKKQAEIQAVKDAEIKNEREAREKLEYDEKSRKEAIEKAELKSVQEAEKLAKAPIKKQLKEWVKDFSIPVSNIEHLTRVEIEEQFFAFKKWANSIIDIL